MATSFEKLAFTKDWNNSSDFPTYEENEAQVRADMQALHDETKNFINEKLIPNIENLAVPGAGDMRADVYDPGGMMQDIFAYARAQAAGAVSTARDNTKSAVSEYDTAQTEKFDGVNVRLAATENALKTTPGAITLLKEYRTPGTHTVELPAGTVAVYALAIGAGGAGGSGSARSGDYGYDYYGGGGGAGGNALFIGPILPEHILEHTAVVGAGGSGSDTHTGYTGAAGESSSVFGLIAKGGNGGASGSSHQTGSLGYAPGGVQEIPTNNEFAGGSGGGGAADRDGSGTAGGSGVTSDKVIPIVMAHFSAGGGGGGSYQAVGGSGGGCHFGDGGKGGDFGVDGSDGGQCCGGGGGGGTLTASKGGKGGDGYVAIWVQRAGVS